MTPQQVLQRPISSERANDLNESLNQVTFEVDPRANKYQIRDAVEFLYPSVKVGKVRTMVVPGKLKRRGTSIGKRSNWKKAIVTLREGTIDFYATE